MYTNFEGLLTLCEKDGLPLWQVILENEKKLLEKEGIVFSKNGYVDMKRHLWNPGENAQNESELSQIP